MYGAIVGDLAGSIYEFDQLKKVHRVQMNNLIEDNAFYSDDTILTIATLDATLNNKDYDYYLRKYIQEYSEYKPDFNPYFKSSFSPNLIKWSKRVCPVEERKNYVRKCCERPDRDPAQFPEQI